MKDTFYFPHDYNARGDEKIVKLIQSYGWEGYGIFWAIIERLYEAGGRLESTLDWLAYDLRLEKPRLKSVIKDFGLFYFPGGGKKIASRSVDRRLKERHKKMALARSAANARWGNASASDAHCKTDARKERKGKERKETTTARPPLAVDKSVDNSDILEVRMPKWCKEYPGAVVVNVPADYCAWALKNVPRLGDTIKKALEARVKLKADEASGMSKVAKL